MPDRERDIEAYFKKRVEALGGLVRKLEFIGHRGAPDRLAILQNNVWFIEFKSAGGVVAAHQLREHARMRAAGATVLVIRSREEVHALLMPYIPSIVPAVSPWHVMQAQHYALHQTHLATSVRARGKHLIRDIKI